MVKVPIAVLGEVVTVTVVDPEPVIDEGLKLAVAPDGKPDVAKLTIPLKPFVPATVSVYAKLAPGVTVAPPGVMPMEKSGWGVTLRDVAALWLSEPVDPMTLIV
jgi:hypothetical protein